MQKKVSAIAGVAALMLAACQTAGNGPVGCDANDYRSFIGKNVAAITLPAELEHRIIGPNDAYTDDYRPDRLNLFTDENGVIAKVECG